MNVTSNGYYSQLYLKQRQQEIQQQQQQQHYQYYAPTPQEMFSHQGRNQNKTQQRREPSMNIDSSSASPSLRQPVMKNIRPRQVSRSLTDPSSQKEFSTSTQSSPASSKQVEYEVDSNDQLEEEITPAQLNYILQQAHNPRYHPLSYSYDDLMHQPPHRQRHHHDHYHDHHHDRHQQDALAPPVPTSYSLLHQEMSQMPRVRRKNKNNDYYLQQQRRYDVADTSMKPKIYTHKTFRDVFEDKGENQERYNPMDSVFENPRQNKEVNEDGKDTLKKSFLSNVRFMKDKYHDYDYYENRKKSNTVKDVFVNLVSDDDDDDDDYDNVNENTVGEDVVNAEATFENGVPRADGSGEQGAAKAKKAKKLKLKHMLKKRLKKASKELGRDFDTYVDESRRIKTGAGAGSGAGATAGTDLLTVEELLDDKEENDSSVPFAEAEVNNNQQAPFALAPYVNYIWSWMPSYLYGNTETVAADPAEVSKELVKSLELNSPETPQPVDAVATLTPAKNKARIQKLKNGSRTLFANWNQPAMMMFNGQLVSQQPMQNKLKTDKRKLHLLLLYLLLRRNPSDIDNQSTITSSAPMEFVVEYDSEEAEDIVTMSEELYYNPITKQLEPEPPTSQSSMMYLQQQNPNLLLLLDPQRPLQIISNLMSLVKKLQIMKLIFSPIDVIGEFFPHLQTVVILLELCLFIWILFELSRLIDALCMMVKAFCAPMIAVGRFMNRIM